MTPRRWSSSLTRARLVQPALCDEMPLFEKIRTIAKEIYHADDAIAPKEVRDQFRA